MCWELLESDMAGEEGVQVWEEREGGGLEISAGVGIAGHRAGVCVFYVGDGRRVRLG